MCQIESQVQVNWQTMETENNLISKNSAFVQIFNICSAYVFECFCRTNKYRNKYRCSKLNCEDLFLLTAYLVFFIC